MKAIYLLYIFIGYLFGSLPWALIIGKVFYKTDIREHGSGNLGGTNAGRVLGKVAGVTVSLLDILKSAIVVALIAPYDLNGAFFAGVGAIFGHCYPLFANFKGGKAVATTYGYLLTTAVLLKAPLLFIIPVLVWVALVFIIKYMSVASMTSVTVAGLTSFFYHNSMMSLCLWIAVALIVYRHKDNIKRLRTGTENKLKI